LKERTRTHDKPNRPDPFPEKREGEDQTKQENQDKSKNIINQDKSKNIINQDKSKNIINQDESKNIINQDKSKNIINQNLHMKNDILYYTK